MYEDLRIEWIRLCVCKCFHLPGRTNSFDRLMQRDHGEPQRTVSSFLNHVTDEPTSSCLLFFKSVREEEVAVRIPIVSEEAEQMEQEDTDGLEGEEREESEGDPVLSYGLELQVVYHTELELEVDHFPPNYSQLRTFYFRRTTNEMVVEPQDMEEAFTVLPTLLDMGLVTGPPLVMLRNKLSHVCLPSLAWEQGCAAGEELSSEALGMEVQTEGTEGSEHKTSLKTHEQLTEHDELLHRLHKFLELINTNLHQMQIQDEIRKLHVPDLDLDQDVGALLSNIELLDELEQCLMNWQTQITVVIEEQQSKKPQAPGPLAEIAFWQERASILSALSEQLKQPAVRRLLEVMGRSQSGTMRTLEATLAELHKYRVEADENLCFVSTLERHFMNLATGKSLTLVLETLPPLMSSLGTVWIISCHYNTNERMVPLMERIAWQLCERVSQAVHVRQLLTQRREVAMALVWDARQVLEQWKRSYFEMRADIEDLGRVRRWEFDRKRLFERTDYMASVCHDLYNVLQVLQDFYNIFGLELKSVTGDTKRIDEVLRRVDGLVLPMKDLTFDPFSISRMTNWKTVMQEFDSTVEEIEGEAIHFIDQSFKTLRSSAAAFDMLLKFKHIGTREAINSHLLRKFTDILAQYCKEVDTINEIFESNRDKPELILTEPPVAGAIRWAHSLMHRIQKTILPFLKEGQMMSCEEGQLYQAKEKYTELALKLREYQAQKYESWKKEAESRLPLLLKKPLLQAHNPAKPKEISVETGSGLQRCIRFSVNFAPEIRQMVAETNGLVSMGYSVPDLARTVALQEGKFIRYVDKLQQLVSSFHVVMDSLSDTMFVMLDKHIKAVRKEMLFGCKTFNWKSLGIPDFISRGVQAVSKFESVVSQILKNEKDIEAKLQSLETANLIKFTVHSRSQELPASYFGHRTWSACSCFGLTSRSWIFEGDL